MPFVMSINVVCVQHQMLETIVDIHAKALYADQTQIVWLSIKKQNACAHQVMLDQPIELVVVLTMMNVSTRPMFVHKVLSA